MRDAAALVAKAVSFRNSQLRASLVIMGALALFFVADLRVALAAGAGTRVRTSSTVSDIPETFPVTAEDAALMESATSTTTAGGLCDFSGIRYPDHDPAVPFPTAPRLFVMVDYWGGVLDGACQGVWAGSEPRNPLQGELLLFNNPQDPHAYNLYASPSGTGPLRIVSEKNGFLTIVSVAGSFVKSTEYDSASSSSGGTSTVITTPGGATYRFDLRTLRFQQ